MEWNCNFTGLLFEHTGAKYPFSVIRCSKTPQEVTVLSERPQSSLSSLINVAWADCCSYQTLDQYQGIKENINVNLDIVNIVTLVVLT